MAEGCITSVPVERYQLQFYTKNYKHSLHASHAQLIEYRVLLSSVLLLLCSVVVVVFVSTVGYVNMINDSTSGTTVTNDKAL
jgi:hypothetical protein